jgi:glycosyltransferase involved in cell wall biosynthesis
MIPEWINQGIEPVIISYDICGEWDIEAPVYHIPQIAQNRLYRIGFAQKKLRKKYFANIVKQCKDIIEKHEIELVFSFAKPMESNIIGAMLKQQCGIRFVSHFSDPWYDNPYSSYKSKDILKEETFIMQQSDRVIFTNAVQQQLVLKKFNRPDYSEKSFSIPHCFNKTEYPAVKAKSDKFILSHIGAFYEQRNPQLLFECLAEVLKNSQLKAKVQVNLVGAVNEYAGYDHHKIVAMLEKYSLTEVVNIIPSVEFAKSLEYIKNSDCLVAIDANMKDSPFLPSKLVDYAGSENTILAITPAGSPTDTFVRDLGCSSFTYDQGEELINYLRQLFEEMQGERVASQKLYKYSVKHTTETLVDIFKGI